MKRGFKWHDMQGRKDEKEQTDLYASEGGEEYILKTMITTEGVDPFVSPLGRTRGEAILDGKCVASSGYKLTRIGARRDLINRIKALEEKSDGNIQ